MRGQIDVVFSAQALGLLRGRAGIAVAAMSTRFGIPLNGGLARIAPPDPASVERGDALPSCYFDDGPGGEFHDYPVD